MWNKFKLQGLLAHSITVGTVRIESTEPRQQICEATVDFNRAHMVCVALKVTLRALWQPEHGALCPGDIRVDCPVELP